MTILVGYKMMKMSLSSSHDQVNVVQAQSATGKSYKVKSYCVCFQHQKTSP